MGYAARALSTEMGISKVAGTGSAVSYEQLFPPLPVVCAGAGPRTDGGISPDSVDSREKGMSMIARGRRAKVVGGVGDDGGCLASAADNVKTLTQQRRTNSGSVHRMARSSVLLAASVRSLGMCIDENGGVSQALDRTLLGRTPREPLRKARSWTGLGAPCHERRDGC